MFSFEGFVRINSAATAVFRLAYLNLLWVATTFLGLVVVGFGPASYALAAYLDRWVRHGETPPPARTFWRLVREQTWHAILLGWILLGVGAVVVTNVLLAPNGTVRALNVVALVALVIVAAYVFPVMAATDITSIWRQLGSALLIGLGSLHWTVLGATVLGVAAWLTWHFAAPLFLLYGAGVPALVVALITRIVFRPLVQSPELPGRTAHHPHDTPVTEQVS
ncbi:YesL family protein [Isoptericola jiangsuensis]|uniref:YesL family protein n=1 Tax=Isoptericola jiangsuensis TaxID=548579 RepID=UPI003AAEEC14